MARKFNLQSTALRKLKGKQRVRFRQEGKSSFRLYVGRNPGVGTVVRSLKTLYSRYFTTTQRECAKQLRRVQKLLKELQKEGYTFSGRMQDILNGNIDLNKKNLDFLETLDKRDLRKRAYSYKGVVDEPWRLYDMWKKEQAEKRRETRKWKEEERRQRELEQSGQRTFDDLEDEEEYPDELEEKIRYIIAEEEQYITEVSEYIYNNAELVQYASGIAQSIIDKIMNSDIEEMKLFVKFWEDNDSLYGVIESAETRFRGLFYHEYGLGYNWDLLNLTPYNAPETSYTVPRSNSDTYKPSSADYDDIFSEYY